MNDTGRIREPVCGTARRILFEMADGNRGDEVCTLLRLFATVDQAHLIMLVGRGIVPAGKARRLLLAIQELARSDYRPLLGRPAYRGLFLLYEDYLIESCGSECGGVLQTARSRNDLNATVFRLRLRRAYLEIARAYLRLGAILIRRAARYTTTVMPAYTHYQPAMPVTLAHYLAGVTYAVFRDMTWLRDACGALHECPLGAAAGAGTTWPIDPEQTAALLGFRRSARHSGDAVGSRDLALRVMAAIAIGGVTLSRVAADLLLWSTMEFGFLELDDAVVGSSSVMPQKRNPFLLEHVVGKAGALSGYFQSGLAAMHAAPFANSIAVGTEGVRPLWPASAELTSSLVLLRLVIAHARPCPAQMLASAQRGATTATAVADYLVRNKDLDFRSAHRAVGNVLREAAARNGSFREIAERMLGSAGESLPPELFDPVAAAGELRYGNGPGSLVVAEQIQELEENWRRFAAEARSWTEEWNEADNRLETAVAGLIAA